MAQQIDSTRPVGALTATGEWKQYWTLVVAATVGFSFMSLINPAIGLFMAPLQAEFGWSRALLSSGSAIGAVMSLLLSPFFGMLIDRFGSRRLAIPGLVATAASIAGFASLNGSEMQWIVLWLVFGLASMTVHSTTWVTAVSSVFKAGRGLALGLTLSGSALSLAVVPPLANWLINEFGWRGAYVWLGLGWGGLAIALCVFFLFDAHDERIRAAKIAVADNQAPARRAELPGLTISEAWRDWALWRVAIATLLILTITVGVAVHQVPIIIDAGISRTNAAWLAGLAGIAGIIGKLVTGALIDRFHVRWIGGLTLASTAFVYPLLLEPFSTPTLIVIAMIVNGYAAGTKLQLCGYLTAQYAGLRNYGTVFGFMSSLIALAGGAGPILAGLAFDQSGGYGPFLIVGIVISIISGLLVFSLGPYPVWVDKADSNQAV